MKNVCLCFLFLISAVTFSYAQADSSVNNSVPTAETSESCPKGKVWYKGKCVKDCDAKRYPLTYIPDANRGTIESCEGKGVRYRYTNCFQEKGWFWNEDKTECIENNCTGYTISERNLDTRAGTYDDCLFYGKTLYAYTSCNKGWDGPQQGVCIKHDCPKSQYPYVEKYYAELVCAGEILECQTGTTVLYGCDGNCKDDYTPVDGSCFLSDCGELYPYSREEETRGCQQTLLCDFGNLNPAYGCEANSGCKDGYHQEEYRCVPNECDKFPSIDSAIPHCEQTESCLQGDRTVYGCRICQKGYKNLAGLCEENRYKNLSSEERKNCQTGDIYYDDDTCSSDKKEKKHPIGIVVDADNSLIMALSFERKNWDNFNQNKGYDVPDVLNVPVFPENSLQKSIAHAQKDLDGEYNTDKFIDYTRMHHIRFPAIEYCDAMKTGGKRWFIPSAGQLLSLSNNWRKIQTSLSQIAVDTLVEEIKNPSLVQNYFWSSTEANLPCLENDSCYKPNQITFTPKPHHMIAIQPMSSANEQGREKPLSSVSKYFANAPMDGLYTLCFANYQKHDERMEEDNDCSDFPFYNDSSESIYENINEMFTSGRAVKAIELEACTDRYGTWYKPSKCPQGYTLDNFGCYVTDCSMYRDAPTDPQIEGCSHFTTCESPNATYYLCDLCERPYELTANHSCILR